MVPDLNVSSIVLVEDWGRLLEQWARTFFSALNRSKVVAAEAGLRWGRRMDDSSRGSGEGEGDAPPFCAPILGVLALDRAEATRALEDGAGSRASASDQPTWRCVWPM